MSSSSRRSFMIRAGWAAAASLCAVGKQVGGRPAVDDDDAPPELQFLVAPERKHIMESMAKEGIPGVSVCLIAEDKAWIEGFGATGGNSSRRVRTDTLFSVQSTSKNFTATAIMLAVQQGILDLDEPITAYLPDFTVQSRFEPVPLQIDDVAAFTQSPSRLHARGTRRQQLRAGVSGLRRARSQHLSNLAAVSRRREVSLFESGR